MSRQELDSGDYQADLSELGNARLRFPLALTSVLLANGIIIACFALKWVGVIELLWSYWLQSVAIGVSNIVRMMKLERFSTKGFSSNGKPVPATPAGRRSTVVFFAMHYGFFHLIYALFLSVFTAEHAAGMPSVLAIAVFVAGLIVGEVLALREQIRIDRQGVPNLGSIMFRPYIRIVPMHLAIVAGGFRGSMVYLFLTLKVLADLGGLVADRAMGRAAVESS